MKKLYIIVLIFTGVMSAQTITFADPDFKAALLATPSCAQNGSGVAIVLDTNGDGEIQVSEALLAQRIVLHDVNVSDLGGIEFFTQLSILNFSDCSVSEFDATPLINLQGIACQNNLLTQLDLSVCPTLRSVNCGSNQLTLLNLSGLVLEYLNCGENQLTSLEANFIEMSDNLIPPPLVYLYCGGNQLSTLVVRGYLHQIFCQDNQLSVLDLSECVVANVDMSDNEPLWFVNIKNGNLDFVEMIFNPTDLTTLPNFNYICVDENEVTDYIMYLAPNVPGLEVNTYCMLTPGGEYHNLAGTVRYDEDGDGCDASDQGMPYLRFSVTGYESQFYSGSNGTYNIPMIPGTYTLFPEVPNPDYFTVSPSEVTVTVDGTENPHIQNFCIAANGSHNDLSVTLIPLSAARPGFDADYQIKVFNHGTTTQSGIVSFEFDGATIDFVSAEPMPASSNDGMLIWNFSDLQPFDELEYEVTLNLNSPMESPPLNGNDILSFYVELQSGVDETPQDNHATLRQTVVNSMDPNDKTCLEGSVIPETMVGGYIHYLIRFENTGTANAENIIVKDIIDPIFLYPGTVTPTGGSHPFTTRVVNGNQFEFVFENINLPYDDANNDGYVVFKVQTYHELFPGSTISNTASIYFDYNYPIVTNTATTTIQLLSNPDFKKSGIRVYPNPVSQSLSFESPSELKSVEIYNLQGQLLATHIGHPESVDVSSLATGTYLLKVTTARGSETLKFVKE